MVIPGQPGELQTHSLFFLGRNAPAKAVTHHSCPLPLGPAAKFYLVVDSSADLYSLLDLCVCSQHLKRVCFASRLCLAPAMPKHPTRKAVPAALLETGASKTRC